MDVTASGILTTATDVLFTGGRQGYFHALDARTGKLLWKVAAGGEIAMGPMTYEVNGVQYVAFAPGSSPFAFALKEPRLLYYFFLWISQIRKRKSYFANGGRVVYVWAVPAGMRIPSAPI